YTTLFRSHHRPGRHQVHAARGDRNQHQVRNSPRRLRGRPDVGRSIQHHVAVSAGGDGTDQPLPVFVIFQGHQFASNGKVAVFQPVARRPLHVVVEQQHGVSRGGELASQVDRNRGFSASALQVHHRYHQGRLPNRVLDR